MSTTNTQRSRPGTAKTLGLLTIAATTLLATSLATPASAQRRVCVETNRGQIVCGRPVDQDGYDRDSRDSHNNDRYDSPSGFDENFYRTAYPDVDAAIAQGRVRSAYDHYRRFGRYEGRYPRFNEASYLSRNPDVAAAVRERRFRNGFEHWRKFGRYENRQL